MVILGRRPEEQKSKARLRTRMPKPAPGANFFEFPDLPRPFRHRDRNREIQFLNEEIASKEIPLKTRGMYVEPNADKYAQFDRFSDRKISECLFDMNKAKYPEFYDKMSYGIKLKPDFPSLPDDLSNRQGLVQPRFQDDKYDEEYNFYDLNEKNKIRLNALEFNNEGRFAPSYQKDKNLHHKVDQIVMALEKNREKFANFEDENEKIIEDDSHDGKGNIFYRSGSSLLNNPQVRREVNEYKPVDREPPMEFYWKKNPINEKDFFKNPDKYRDWDKNFHVEDYV